MWTTLTVLIKRKIPEIIQGLVRPFAETNLTFKGKGLTYNEFRASVKLNVWILMPSSYVNSLITLANSHLKFSNNAGDDSEN